MRIVGQCPMSGFHEHVSRSRLFHSALEISFCGEEIRLINLRGEQQERQTTGEKADVIAPSMPLTSVQEADLEGKPMKNTQAPKTTPMRSPTTTSTENSSGQHVLNAASGTLKVTSLRSPTTSTEDSSGQHVLNAASASGTLKMSCSKLRNLSTKLEKARSPIETSWLTATKRS